ncbi:nucleoside hydrolase [Verrucomicrobiaceae bacterium 227]
MLTVLKDQTHISSFRMEVIFFVLLFMLGASGLRAESPVKLILDTDMSGDADDAGTLAMLHALTDLGECELLAIVTNRKDLTNASAAAVDAINTYYGRPEIPIGTDKAGPTALKRASEYTSALRDEFPNDIGPDDQAPDALKIYREALKDQPDQSVVICSVGAFSNLAALCREDLALVKKKVRHLIVMGGQIPPKETPEVNIAAHVEAARYVASHWPGKIYWQGFRVGHPVMTGNKLKQTPKSNPVRRAYELRHFGARFAINGGQPSYDQAAAYFAVRGFRPELWKEQKGGRVSIDKVGFCSYQEDAAGEHVLVTRACPPARLAKLIEALMIASPGKSGGR